MRERRFGLFSEHVRGERRAYWLEEDLGRDGLPAYVEVLDDDYPGRHKQVTDKRVLENWARRKGVLID